MLIHRIQNACPETPCRAQLRNTEAIIAIKGQRETHARNERGNVRAVVEPAQRVHGAGDQRGEFLCIGTAGLMNHARIDADQARFGIGLTKSGGGRRQARKGQVEPALEHAGARKAAERIHVEIEFQACRRVLLLSP